MKPALALLAVLVALELSSSVAGAPAGGTTLSVTPGSVDRYDSYAITVIGPANASFSLDVYGSNSFHLNLGNRTDETGIWRQTEQAWYDFGEYDVHLVLGNASLWASVIVGCDARCTSGILQQNGLQTQQLIYALATEYGTFLLLALLVFEVPRQVVFFRDRARLAREQARFTDRETVSSILVRLRGFIQPGDQVTDPKNIQNPRIAADMRRRRLVEQLHDATAHRYLPWRPGHIKDIKAIVRDLETATAELLTLQPEAEPYAPAYVRSQDLKTMIEKTKTETSDVPHADTNKQELAAGPRSPRISNASHGEQTVIPIRHRLMLWTAGAVLALGSSAVALIILSYAGVTVSVFSGLWYIWPTTGPVQDLVKIVSIIIVTGVVSNGLWILGRPRKEPAA